MTLARDTSSLCGWHFCTAILKLIHNLKKVTDRTRTLPPYSLFLNTFDLAVTLIFDLRTLLLYATHRLYMVDISAQLYWNSFIIQISYRPDTNTSPPYSMFLNTFDLAVTLTFDLRTWLLYATHRLYVVNICAKLFGDQVLGGKVMARTRTSLTDRRTDGQTKQKLYAPEKKFSGA